MRKWKVTVGWLYKEEYIVEAENSDKAEDKIFTENLRPITVDKDQPDILDVEEINEG